MSARRFEVVECAALRGEPARYMVLVNGFQWGGDHDASGSGDATFPTEEAATRAYVERAK